MEKNSTQLQWHWQQEGTSWKGIGIYHVTLTIPSREPLLGRLVIPNNDPTQAYVEATELGRVLLDCQRSVPLFHPEIQILQYCLMPDHLHSIWYVRRPMEKSIRYVAQGFWRAVKKAGRAFSYLRAAGTASSLRTTSLAGGAMNESTGGSSLHAAPTNLAGGAMSESAGGGAMSESAGGGAMNESTGGGSLHAAPAGLSLLAHGGRPSLSSLASASSQRETPLRALLGDDAYYALPPLFTEVPFLRPLSRRGQLQAMIHYVQLNPQRLATKRLMPGFFRVQTGIAIAGHTYSAVGNITLLQAARLAPVHVRRWMVEAAHHGETEALRNYMNGCVLAARQGAVMVSPFISQQEKDVQAVLLREQHPLIVLADNGFRDYYKPSAHLFEATAAGRVLILSPWAYDAGKRHISRADCVALNKMAEDIAAMT